MVNCETQIAFRSLPASPLECNRPNTILEDSKSFASKNSTPKYVTNQVKRKQSFLSKTSTSKYSKLNKDSAKQEIQKWIQKRKYDYDKVNLYVDKY
jgi:hypothetical protein